MALLTFEDTKASPVGDLLDVALPCQHTLGANMLPDSLFPPLIHPPERTVALLAFQDTKASPVGDLLDVAQRQKTASELNAAILASQCQENEPRLPVLLKLMVGEGCGTVQMCGAKSGCLDA